MHSLRFALIAVGALGATSTFGQTPDKAKIDAGEEVYNTYCATCHGSELVSSGQTFDLRRLKATDRPRFENSVINGKNQMPPWRGVLKPDDIENLWHYIRANAYEK